jgi:hypothetical protein
MSLAAVVDLRNDGSLSVRIEQGISPAGFQHAVDCIVGRFAAQRSDAFSLRMDVVTALLAPVMRAVRAGPISIRMVCRSDAVLAEDL